MSAERWARFRLTIIISLVLFSLGIALGVRLGAIGALHHCGVIAAGGR